MIVFCLVPSRKLCKLWHLINHSSIYQISTTCRTFTKYCASEFKFKEQNLSKCEYICIFSKYFTFRDSAVCAFLHFGGLQGRKVFQFYFAART